jgi:hypothetical protein
VQKPPLTILAPVQKKAFSQGVSLSTRKENSRVVVTLQGPLGTAGTLRVSEDLRSWQNLQDFVLTTGTLSIADQNSGARRKPAGSDVA